MNKKEEVLHELGIHTWIDIPLELTASRFGAIAHRCCPGCKRVEYLRDSADGWVHDLGTARYIALDFLRRRGARSQRAHKGTNPGKLQGEAGSSAGKEDVWYSRV